MTSLLQCGIVPLAVLDTRSISNAPDLVDDEFIDDFAPAAPPDSAVRAYAAAIAERVAASIADDLRRELRLEIESRAESALRNAPPRYFAGGLLPHELDALADSIAESLPEKRRDSLVDSTGALVERAIDSASGNGA